MKKLIALLLSCALLVCLFSACGTEAPTNSTTQTEESVAEATELTPSDIETEAPVANEYINYKGLTTADYTLDDVIAAEGREPDFNFEVGDTTYYAYNNVTLEDMTFTQVQFSFTDAGNRISCTYSGDEDQTAVMDRFCDSLSGMFGSCTASETMFSWTDGLTANYVMLTALNETTVQVAFYINEGVSA